MAEFIISVADSEKDAIDNIIRCYATEELVRCKDCKYRSFYCTEATDGTTLYECHHPCANSVARPGNWFCAEGKRKEGR